MKKLKLIEFLVYASGVVSLVSVLFGWYQILNSEYFLGYAFTFGGIAFGYFTLFWRRSK